MSGIGAPRRDAEAKMERFRRWAAVPALALILALPPLAASGCGERAGGSEASSSSLTASDRRALDRLARDQEQERKRPRELNGWGRFAKGWHNFWREEFGESE